MDAERRGRFRAWFARTYGDAEGARARFIADSGRLGHEELTKGRVAQLFDEKQPFGERAARNLSERFGLAPDFFLKDRSPARVSDEAMKLAAAYEKLSPTEKQRFRLLMMAARDGITPNIDVAPGRTAKKKGPRGTSVFGELDDDAESGHG